VAPLRRWLPFAAAALATVLLAGGFGLAASRLASPRSQPVPQLRTVSAATLARIGVTVSAPVQPAYCGIADAAVGQGWIQAGSAGCAIDQATAEASARQGGGARVVESLLAQVSSTRVAAIGHDRLTWLVVTQQSFSACQQPATGWSICLGGRGGFAWSQLVLVDAHSASIVNSIRLTPAVRPLVPGRTSAPSISSAGQPGTVPTVSGGALAPGR
jgi:hypothetical protein